MHSFLSGPTLGLFLFFPASDLQVCEQDGAERRLIPNHEKGTGAGSKNPLVTLGLRRAQGVDGQQRWEQGTIRPGPGSGWRGQTITCSAGVSRAQPEVRNHRENKTIPTDEGSAQGE